MKVLVVGSGGREHAICWALKKSPKVTELYCAPGNGGIGEIARCVDVKATDIPGMVAWAKEHSIDFVMVAPRRTMPSSPTRNRPFIMSRSRARPSW